MLARVFGSLAPAWPQFLSSMVMLVLGFAVKDSVGLAIRQQQLPQNFAASARSGLEKMSVEGADPEATKQAAVVVAAFGSAAAMPLVNELCARGNRTVGADAAPEAHALAQALIGVLQWKGVAYPPDDAARRAAAQSFAKAAALMPALQARAQSPDPHVKSRNRENAA